MVERRSPKPFVVGSSPTWPARPITGLPLRKAASQVDASKKAAPAQAASAKKAAPKKKHFARLRGWFADVKAEMHRVTWPSKSELKNYSVAVIVMLVVFGVAVWLVDTGVVAALVGYSGLRG